MKVSLKVDRKDGGSGTLIEGIIRLELYSKTELEGKLEESVCRL